MLPLQLFSKSGLASQGPVPKKRSGFSSSAPSGQPVIKSAPMVISATPVIRELGVGRFIGVERTRASLRPERALGFSITHGTPRGNHGFHGAIANWGTALGDSIRSNRARACASLGWVDYHPG